MSSKGGRRPNLPERPNKVVEQIVQWEGPVPPPQVIEAYDRLVPGSAQIMWSNFDEQSSHRRELEKVVVGGSERRANLGQFMAVGLIVLAMCFGLVISLTVSAVAGSTVIVGSIGSGALVYFAGGRAPEVREASKGDES